jgi:hypothetical protein
MGFAQWKSFCEGVDREDVEAEKRRKESANQPPHGHDHFLNRIVDWTFRWREVYWGLG